MTLGGLGSTGGDRWSLGVWDGEDMSCRAFMFGINKGQPTYTPMNDSISLEPNTGYVLTRIDGIQVWQIPSGLEVAKLENKKGEQSWSGCFVSDSALLSGQDYSMDLFDVSDPTRPASLKLPFEQSQTMSASHWASGSFATATRISGGDPVIRLFQMEKGKAVLKWKQSIPKNQWVTHLDFDPNGQKILSECGNGVIEIRNTDDGSLLKTFKLPRTEQLSFLNDDNHMVAIRRYKRSETGAEDQLVLIDASTGKITLSVTNQVQMEALAVSPDRKLVAVAGTEQVVELRDAQTLEIKSRFRAHDGVITALAFHPTQPLIVSGSSDGSVKFWDIRSGSLRGQFLGIRGAPVSLAMNPSGKLLAVEGMEKTARLFDISEISPGGAGELTQRDGSRTILIKGAKLMELQSLFDQGQAVDLVQAVQSGRAMVAGNWVATSGGLASPPKVISYARFPLNFSAAPSYQIQIKFQAVKPHESLAIYLPLGERATNFLLDGGPSRGFHTGFRRLDGQERPTDPYDLKGQQIRDEKPHVLQITVKTKEGAGTGSIRVVMDNRQLVDWEGELSRLDLPADGRKHPVQLTGLWSYGQEWLVSSFQVQPLKP